MEQSPPDIGARPELVTEEVDFPLMDGTGYAVIDRRSRNPAGRSIPDGDRGLMRKFADACLYFVCRRRFGDTLINRQRD